MKKKTKKESHKKNEKLFFKTQKKRQNTDKQNVKKCRAKKETIKIVFKLRSKDIRKRKFCRRVQGHKTKIL